MRTVKIILLLSTMTIIFPSRAISIKENEDLLAQSYKSFKLGEYQKALDSLEKVSGETKIESSKSYFQGLCFNRLKKYNEAINSFEKAQSLNHPAEDIDYEMGQAYYATNNLEKASSSFDKSVKKKFKVDSALYYQGFSAQLLEDYKKAKTYYARLLQWPELNAEMRQATEMQLAEVFLAMTEEKKDQKELVEKYVIEHFEKAIAANKDSPLGPEISKRMAEVKKRFDLDPNIMINQRQLPEKKYTLAFTQKMVYDSNITLSTDLPTVQTIQKDSYIVESIFSGRYRFNFFRMITSTPDLRITYKRHNDQDSSTVIQNDQQTTTGTLYNTIEHKLAGKMASLLLDYEHNLTNQDRTTTHKNDFFSYYDQGTLGERVQFFSFGETAIKSKFKKLKSYSKTIDSNTYTLSLDQVAIVPIGHLFMGLFQIDYTRFADNPNQNTNSYLIRFDYIIPEIIPKFMLNLAYSHTWLNPVNQKNTRGVEVTWNPSFRLTRTITPNLKSTLSYSYTIKHSDNETTFSYHKHVTGLEIRYDF